MSLLELIEGLKLFAEYTSDLLITLAEDEIRIRIQSGVALNNADTLVLKELGWHEDEGDWVRWV